MKKKPGRNARLRGDEGDLGGIYGKKGVQQQEGFCWEGLFSSRPEPVFLSFTPV
jgi:hypothetical protein